MSNTDLASMQRKRERIELERQRELGPEAYRQEALERMRRLKATKTLPYDKGNWFPITE